MKASSFEIASGTVCGADHLGEFGVPGLSINQDASYSVTVGNTTIAVVSDGCSDRPESSVGAALLCRFFVAAVRENLPVLMAQDSGCFAKKVQAEIVSRIRSVCTLSVACGDKQSHSVTQVADELFLCTLIGAVLTPDHTVILAAGDGVWCVNNKPLQKLGPFPRNEPPYLGYLVRGNHSEHSELKVIAVYPTSKVASVCIGSDGCDELPPDFLKRLKSQRSTFTNPELLNRELRKLNSQSIQLSGDSDKLKFHVNASWSERTLSDDTTIIIINKIPEQDLQPQQLVGNQLASPTPLAPSKQQAGSVAGSVAGWGFPGFFGNKAGNKGNLGRGVNPNSKGDSHDLDET